MKKLCVLMLVGGVAFAGFTAPAEAGCLAGAAVGGVAGHVAGHHGLLGAAAGCAIGHHRSASRRDAERGYQQESYRNGNEGYRNGGSDYRSGSDRQMYGRDAYRGDVAPR
ncbi:MAG: hypothetical protein NVSMB18_28790 [Acetobacteraceae bacterium]